MRRKPSRIASFFRALDTPISPTRFAEQEHDPAQSASGSRHSSGRTASDSCRPVCEFNAGPVYRRHPRLNTCGPWFQISVSGQTAERSSSNRMNARISCACYVWQCSLHAAAAETEWLLPNFANRLSVEVRNGGNSQLRALATLPIVKAQAVAPDFPGRLALAVLVDRQFGQAGRSLPHSGRSGWRRIPG